MSILDRFRRKKQAPDTTRHITVAPVQPVTRFEPLPVPVDTSPSVTSIPSFHDSGPSVGCGASPDNGGGGTDCGGF